MCGKYLLCGMAAKKKKKKRTDILGKHTLIHTKVAMCMYPLSQTWEYLVSIKRKTLEKCTFSDRLIHHHHWKPATLRQKFKNVHVGM